MPSTRAQDARTAFASRPAPAYRLGVERPSKVTSVGPGALRAGVATPGVVREVACETGRATLMRARAEPHAASGWHHHGERDVFGYVVRGRARFEFGTAGGEHVDVEEGAFFHVPAGLVHRDVNPADEPQEIVLTVVGDGPLVVNGDGPDGVTVAPDDEPVSR